MLYSWKSLLDGMHVLHQQASLLFTDHHPSSGWIVFDPTAITTSVFSCFQSVIAQKLLEEPALLSRHLVADSSEIIRQVLMTVINCPGLICCFVEKHMVKKERLMAGEC